MISGLLLLATCLLTRFPVFIQTFTPESQETVTSQMQSIRSLSGKGVSTVHTLVSSDARPPGCVSFVVSAAAAVFLHVKGRVDIDEEITKATKKLGKATGNIEKQKKLLEGPGFQEKASEELKAVEQSKLKDLETERHTLEQTIKQFEGLKLE